MNKKDNMMSRSESNGSGGGKGGVFIHNMPIFTTYFLGTLILWFVGWLFALIYIAYCLLSTLWFMRFICTHCPHYGSLKCPSGYAMVAGIIFSRKDTNKFHRNFKRHIAVVVPSWIIPAVGAIYVLTREFSMFVLILFLVFCVVGYLILPYITRKTGCSKCELRKDCPWMGRFGK